VDGSAWVSLVLLGLLAIGSVVGLFKGLIRQVVELAGMVVSFLLATLFAGWLANALARHTSLPYSPSLVIAFLLVFIAGMVAFHFLAAWIQKLVQMTFLGWFDRLCGALLGLIVGLIVTSLLLSVALELPLPREVHLSMERSSVALFVRPIAPWLFDAVFSHGERGIDYDAIFKRGGTV